MRRLLSVLPALAVTFLSSLAVAGDGCPVSGSCVNECPLAQDVGSHRSTGEEAIFASTSARASYVKAIARVIAGL